MRPPIRSLISLLLLASALPAAEEYTYWVEPCTAATAQRTGCAAGDAELARWALEAWQRESKDMLTFRKTEAETHARLRIYWANGSEGLYGEAQPVMVDGKPGSKIYVLPDRHSERLLRDAIVYLTCLHESGHALGLRHTEEFADIMYTFTMGGDIQEYFGRYRRLLQTREDIQKHSGISDADRIAIRRLAP